MLHARRPSNARQNKAKKDWTKVKQKFTPSTYVKVNHGSRDADSRKWWEGKSIGECEHLIHENTKLQWATKVRTSKEADPLLKNSAVDNEWRFDAKAFHLAGIRKLTAACEERREKKVIDVNEYLESGEDIKKRLSQRDFYYSISSGKVKNTRDTDKIYHVEYDQQFSELDLKDCGTCDIKANKMPSQGLNLMLERRYVSLVPRFLQEVKNGFEIGASGDGGYDNDTVSAINTTLDALTEADKSDSLSEEPDISHSNTSDYIIYTCSSTYKKIVQPDKMIRIRRRMVVASMRYSNPPINIPLAEEIFVETLSKDVKTIIPSEDAPFKPDDNSVVLNISLVSDSHGRKQADSTSNKCNASTISFFGKNAFAMLVGGFTPSNKQHFVTGHETAMYMMGWLIRKLDGAVISAKEEKLLSNPMFEALVNPSGAGFITEQNAGVFVKRTPSKYYYTNTWLATQTLAVVSISPATDTSKSIVMVWSGGRLIGDDVLGNLGEKTPEKERKAKPTNGKRLPPINKPPMDGTNPPPSDNLRPKNLDDDPLPPRTFNTPRVVPGNWDDPIESKYTATSLPLDLELELQSL